jgi:hypothetical protein
VIAFKHPGHGSVLEHFMFRLTTEGAIEVAIAFAINVTAYAADWASPDFSDGSLSL